MKDDYNGNFEIGRDCLNSEMKKARIAAAAARLDATLSKCCGQPLVHDPKMGLWICPSCQWMYDSQNQVVGIREQIERRLGPVNSGPMFN